ncbi:MAG: type VI secretion system baseplate subunit TssF [Myxococcales bacterium]|nr:type VI secretion system baseplate subunit TssF [Myxococcales bacterium]
MRDDLLLYYERELRFIRKMAADFAEKYPEVAGRLQLEPTKCEDPHVERMIEAFAMLAARVHLRIDDDFSEVSDALLEILYPHYLRPIPSMTICQLSLDPEQGGPGEGLSVPRHSLLRARPVDGVRCVFRTSYPLKLWPIAVESVEVGTVSGPAGSRPAAARSELRIRLRSQGGVPLSELSIDSLRFFLNDLGGSLQVLYEMFLRDPVGLRVQWGSEASPVVLGPENIRDVGFGRDEDLLEYPPESFVGYRLLQEYFAFPEKFLFVELSGLDRAPRAEAADFLELSVLLRQSAASIDVKFTPDHLQLHCTPAVNLFPQRPDPIRLTQTSIEYPLVPDARAVHSYEIHSITEVESTTPGTDVAQRFLPFYALRHGMARGAEAAYWYAWRRESIRKGDPGTDVFIALVDPNFDPVEASADVLHVTALCTNRDIPARLPFNDPRGDFQLEGRPEIASIRCLRKPTPPVRAPMGRENRWRIVSHLALNYLSLVDADARSENGEGAKDSALAALREILKIYDYKDSAATRQRIAGLVGLRARKVLRRAGHAAWAGFARGMEVELEFDNQQYTGSGVLPFAAVLERFLGLYTSINSFTQTVARIRQREEVLKRWPPRAGEIQLL